jgi:tRNA(Ile)-lysidine synthase
MTHSALTRAVARALEGQPGGVLLVGLSGGADSVALLDSLLSLAPVRPLRVVAAHLDHGLRADSAEDAAFCEQLCRTLAVPLHAGRADVRARAAREKRGVEEAARRERYAFLRSVAREVGADAIAVAHTRDDQAETLLLRLLRGAGRTGLSAMRVRSGDILRPLLHVSRAQVEAHLTARGLTWREDASNRELSIPRNRIRHELLPYLESRFNPSVRVVLARTAGLLSDESVFLEGLAATVPVVVDAGREAARVDLARLREAPLAVRRIVLRRALSLVGLGGIAGRHVEKILALASKQCASGLRLPLPGSREAAISFGSLRLGPPRRAAPAFATPLDVPGEVALPGGGRIVAEPGEAAPGAPGVLVPAPLGRLEVRTRRPGDRLWLRGRDVSLRRYLMAQRVDADARGALPLVACGSRVLWLAGQALEPPSAPAAGERLVRLHLESA